MPLAVLDTSVLVPVWSRVVLQQLAARADAPYVPVWSEWIIAEKLENQPHENFMLPP